MISLKRAYEPGKFTTLVGYEFTSAPDGRNLHRNVIFATDKAPELPYTAHRRNDPDWMVGQLREHDGIRTLHLR